MAFRARRARETSVRGGLVLNTHVKLQKCLDPSHRDRGLFDLVDLRQAAFGNFARNRAKLPKNGFISRRFRLTGEVGEKMTGKWEKSPENGSKLRFWGHFLQSHPPGTGVPKGSAPEGAPRNRGALGGAPESAQGDWGCTKECSRECSPWGFNRKSTLGSTS